MKICIIGAGSSYTPELIEGLIKFERKLDIPEVFLYDIDNTRLEIITHYLNHLVNTKRSKIKLYSTLDRIQALKDADFIITQIRVGGNKARKEDSKLALKYNLIAQETTGICGFMKAFRTIPVMINYAKEIEKLAPSSFLINFTNPSGMITEALIKYSKLKVIGLCNIPTIIKVELANKLKVSVDKIKLDYVGLNHLSWIRKIYINGKNIIEEILNNKLLEDLKEFDDELLKNLNMIPSYYLKYYYYPERELKKLKHKKITRAEEVIEIEKKLFNAYKNNDIDNAKKLLNMRGGAHYSTAAVELIDSIYNNSDKIHIVNIKNDNAIENFDKDSVVEIPARVNKYGVKSLKLGRIEPQIKGLMEQIKSYEKLTIEAVIRKNKKLAYLALLNNPLIKDASNIKVILSKINTLPQFM